MSRFDDVVALLRRSSAQLIEMAETIDPTAPAYPSEWSIAQVYSHLGSGAELGLNTIQAALGEAEPVERQEVWARWNAYPPARMVSEFVDFDRRMLDYLQGLDPVRRDHVSVPFFLGPVDVSTLMLFRLSEHALHNWDVRVTLDTSAEVDAEAAPLVLQNVTARVIGHLAKHDPTPHQTGVSIIGDLPLFLALGDPAQLRPPAESDDASGRLTISPPTLLRLLSGRLDPQHTPPSVQAEGRPTIEQLRMIFPGF